MLHGNQRFLSHHGCRKLTGRLSLPIFICLMQTLLCIVRNIKRIRLTRCYCVILFLHPCIGVLRKHLTSARRDRIASNDQFQRTDHDRQFLTDCLKRLRATHDDRLIFCLAIALCHDLCTVSLDHRHIRKQMIDQFLNSGRLFDLSIVVLFRHNHTLHIYSLIPSYVFWFLLQSIT